jgi:DNA modification methylase
MIAPYLQRDGITLYAGDCLDVLRELPDASIDAVVTDPPYGLGFMGKEWDSGKSFVERKPAKRNTFDHVGGNHNPSDSADSARTRRSEAVKFGAWCELWAAECLRVLKPGGHLLAFGGTRTWHRLACAVEDAGFEIRDSIAWLYGSGFPKSLDVSKAIDKAAGAEREVVAIDPRYVGMSDAAKRALGTVVHEGTGGTGFSGDPSLITAPATPDAERWQGWGTALKPAFEPVVVARQPLVGTVASNVLAHGTGALNVDDCRIGTEARDKTRSTGDLVSGNSSMAGGNDAREIVGTVEGRWPANVVLDETQADALDQQSGEAGGGTGISTRGGGNGGEWNPTDRNTSAGQTVRGDGRPVGFGDTGGASRFYYVAKASTAERPRYWSHDCDCPHDKPMPAHGVCDVCGTPGKLTAHATVKPLALMRWLVRLVTPPGGTVLEPFSGSGTTIEACLLEGYRCVAVEKEADYLPLIESRIARQRDPVRAVELAGADAGLFEFITDEEVS